MNEQKNQNSSLQKTPSGHVEGNKKGDKIPAQELLPVNHKITKFFYFKDGNLSAID